MKKIKYLMPILGLTSIASIAMPLTSCGCGSDPAVTQYTVKFDTQGGSTIADVKVDKDGLVTKPTDPAKDRYEFGGWFTDKECNTAFDFGTKITADITLYAKWTFDGKILNQQEFTDSVNLITTVNTNRNFTMEIVSKVGTTTMTNTYNVVGKQMVYTVIDESSNKTTKCAEIEKYGERWDCIPNDDYGWQCNDYLGDTESECFWESCLMALALIKNKDFTTFTFDQTTKTYSTTWSFESSNEEFPIDFRFAAPGQIEYIKIEGEMANDKMEQVTTISDYGKTDISEFISQVNPYNLFEMTEGDELLTTVSHDLKEEVDYFYACDMEKLTSYSGTATNLRVGYTNDTDVSSNPKIFANGQELDEDDDYEVKGTPKYIAFKKADVVKKDTKLVFQWEAPANKTGVELHVGEEE